MVADLRRRGVDVRFLRRRFKYDPLAWWPLFRTLRRERIDVLHTHAFGQNAWGSLIGRWAGMPVVIAHEHNWAFTGRALRPVIDRELIARCADAMIVVSEDARRRMIEVERIPPERLVLLPNGVHALPPGDGRAIRAELGIGTDDPVVGTVCIIRSEKALDVLVGAAAREGALSSSPPGDRRRWRRPRAGGGGHRATRTLRPRPSHRRPNRRAGRPRRDRRRGALLGLRGQSALSPGVHGRRQADRRHRCRRGPGADRRRGPRRARAAG